MGERNPQAGSPTSDQTSGPLGIPAEAFPEIADRYGSTLSKTHRLERGPPIPPDRSYKP
jgi:hypothetical protein